jgi:hypothetical protein
MGTLWLWSYGSWIYNYLCNQCLSPLKLWVRIPLMARCTWYNIILVSDLWQVNVFFRVLLFPPPIKLTATVCRTVVLFKDLLILSYLRVRVMVFNATFNNISVILWQSVLLVEETGVPGKKHWPATSHWPK